MLAQSSQLQADNFNDIRATVSLRYFACQFDNLLELTARLPIGYCLLKSTMCGINLFFLLLFLWLHRIHIYIFKENNIIKGLWENIMLDAHI